jgi:hypothetical protein
MEVKDKKEIAVSNDKPQDNNNNKTMWNDVSIMRDSWKMAEALSQTSIIPQAYSGKAGDCLIAIDIANRLCLSPIVIMQNSQVVRGNFTWKGTACKGMIDNSGKYEWTEYVETGVRGTDTWGCYLQALDKKTGKIIKGTEVSIKMAKDEGWYNKDGSKWKTMPELMLKYRASAFFMRTECAGVSMGFLTTEEIIDIGGVEENKTSSLTSLLDKEIEGEKQAQLPSPQTSEKQAQPPSPQISEITSKNEQVSTSIKEA